MRTLSDVGSMGLNGPVLSAVPSRCRKTAEKETPVKAPTPLVDYYGGFWPRQGKFEELSPGGRSNGAHTRCLCFLERAWVSGVDSYRRRFKKEKERPAGGFDWATGA